MAANVVYDSRYSPGNNGPINPGETANVSWVDVNSGDEPSDTYQDTVSFYPYDTSKQQIDRTVDCGGLQPSEAVTQQASVDQLPSGQWTVMVSVNGAASVTIVDPFLVYDF